MIMNNYRALQFIRQMKDELLSPRIIFQLQTILTEGTLDEPDAAARFRRDDEKIVVSDHMDGSVLHDPPKAGLLPGRMEQMCAFANAPDTGEPFIHPVVRSILLHFWLAYDHPVRGWKRAYCARAVLLVDVPSRLSAR